MSPIPPSTPRPARTGRPGIPPRPLSVPPAPITLPSTPAPSFASPPTPSRSFTPFAAPAPAAAPGSTPASGAMPAASASATLETPAHPPSIPPQFAPYATSAPLARDWYVYQPDGRHLGPLSTDFLARGWVGRQVPRDIYVGTAGEAGWRPISQVPEIMEAVRALEAWNQVMQPSLPPTR